MCSRIFSAWPTLAAWLWVGLQGYASDVAADLYITHVSVVDPEKGVTHADRTLFIRDGLIVAVEDSAKTEVPQDAEQLDGHGKFLIPGLWDMHVHLADHGETDLAMLVANGVLYVRDMGGDPFKIRYWRERIRSDDLIGPHIRAAGPILEDRGWLMPRRRKSGLEHRIPVDNPAEARAMVALVKGMGMDLIKIRNVTDRITFEAIMAAARGQGLTVAGHEPMIVSMKEAAELGMTTIEHLPFLSMTLPGQEADEPLIRSTIQAMVEQGTFVTPTLVACEGLLVSRESLRKRLADGEPRMVYISDHVLDGWRESIEDDRGSFDWPDMLRRSLAILKRMHRAGVPLLAATDMAVPFTFPGFALHDELVEMSEKLDLSPAEVLKTATVNPARLFGVQGQDGAVKPGYHANLVVLNANPLEAIGHGDGIHAVVLDGRLMRRAALDQLMKKAAAEKNHPSPTDNLVSERETAFKQSPDTGGAIYLGQYYFSKGDFNKAWTYLNHARGVTGSDDPSLLPLALSAGINGLFWKTLECGSIEVVARETLKLSAENPNESMGILSRLLAALSAAGCGEVSADYLKRVAALAPDSLDPVMRFYHRKYMAEYIFKVKGDADAAYTYRVEGMSRDWDTDPSLLREMAQWCLKQGLNLEKGRELAQKSARLAKAELDKLRAMLLEAEIADAMGQPGDAVRIMEEVKKIFSNEYVQNLLKTYRARLAEQK